MVSSLSAFLGEIGRHQLLTPEQELTLGRKVQAMAALTERCTMAGGEGDACVYSDEEKRIIKRGEKAKSARGRAEFCRLGKRGAREAPEDGASLGRRPGAVASRRV